MNEAKLNIGQIVDGGLNICNDVKELGARRPKQTRAGVPEIKRNILRTNTLGILA
jgi:hypothetical protein